LLPHPIWGTKLAKSWNGSSLLLTPTEGPQQIQLRRRRRHTKKNTWWIRASSLVLFLQATSSHVFPAIEKLPNSGHHRRKPIVDAAATKWADKLQCNHGGTTTTTTTTTTVPLPNSSSSQAESQSNLALQELVPHKIKRWCWSEEMSSRACSRTPPPPLPLPLSDAQWP
jgi:hypothetical protein